MARDIEKSREYEYGEEKEFKTREEAMEQAIYKLKSMLTELGSKKKLDGETEIVDTGSALQVKIPVMWE